MILVVSQNAPFVPMFDAWRVDSREMLPYEAAKARRDAEIIDAKVLSNRNPPYSLAGGLYDALKATGGDIMVATNAQARKARALIEETEGIDIYSAAGLATASLVKSVADGRIDPEKIVMLNITGGGEHRCQQDKELWYLEPSLVFPLTPCAAICAISSGRFCERMEMQISSLWSASRKSVVTRTSSSSVTRPLERV